MELSRQITPIKHSPSQEGKSHSSSPEIPRLLWTTKIHTVSTRFHQTEWKGSFCINVKFKTKGLVMKEQRI